MNLWSCQLQFLSVFCLLWPSRDPRQILKNQSEAIENSRINIPLQPIGNLKINSFSFSLCMGRGTWKPERIPKINRSEEASGWISKSQSEAKNFSKTYQKQENCWVNFWKQIRNEKMFGQIPEKQSKVRKFMNEFPKKSPGKSPKTNPKSQGGQTIPHLEATKIFLPPPPQKKKIDKEPNSSR